jgi:hypothetical protein
MVVAILFSFRARHQSDGSREGINPLWSTSDTFI